MKNYETLMKNYENHWKSMKNFEKLIKNYATPMKNYEKLMRNQEKTMKHYAKLWTLLINHWKNMQTNKKSWKPFAVWLSQPITNDWLRFAAHEPDNLRLDKFPVWIYDPKFQLDIAMFTFLRSMSEGGPYDVGTTTQEHSGSGLFLEYQDDG